MKNATILYLGDTAINQAASYLAGIMTHFNMEFDYIPSDRKVSDDMLDKNYKAIIISDYPAHNFTTRQLDIIAQNVSDGMGLMMIGGWESFVGLDGKYNETVLADILPVKMQNSDDRVNCPQPCLIELNTQHQITQNLPFTQCPPCIGGYNLIKAKPSAKTILSARKFNVRFQNKKFIFQPEDNSDPLLVIGNYEKGRTLAFATDVAPHWVGGLVDWGNKRITAQAEKHGAEQIEVGNHYAELFANMINWLAKITA